MSCNFCLFFNLFVPKVSFLKVFDGALLFWILWVFFLGLSNLKMTQTTLNTSFSHRFGKVIGD
jgi:hypothetical protein